MSLRALLGSIVKEARSCIWSDELSGLYDRHDMAICRGCYGLFSPLALC